MPGVREPQLHRLLKRAKSLLDLQLHVLDTVFQVANVSKDLSKQHLMMQLDLPMQSLLKLGQFVAESATSQISQYFGIAHPLDHSREHPPPTLVQHRTSHRG